MRLAHCNVCAAEDLGGPIQASTRSTLTPFSLPSETKVGRPLPALPAALRPRGIPHWKAFAPKQRMP